MIQYHPAMPETVPTSVFWSVVALLVGLALIALSLWRKQ